ncbi:MAG: hypothetical protein M1419_03160 [Bacteroidetes bacterium]|nr:hypothetical protein [Bacteroidota bacterium]
MKKINLKTIFKPAERDLGQFYLIYFYGVLIIIITNTIVGAEEKLKESYIIFGLLLLQIGYQIGKNRESIKDFFLRLKLKFSKKSNDLPEIN